MSPLQVYIVDTGYIFGQPDINEVKNKSIVLDHTSFKPEKHGTLCAKLLASTGVSCTYKALENPNVGIIQFKHALQISTEVVDYNSLNADLYSESWGCYDNGIQTCLQHTQNDAYITALRHSVTRGRDSKGAIHIWAAGNGGVIDDCVMDRYANNPYVISVAVTNAQYNENCASLLGTVVLPKQQTLLYKDHCIPIPGGSSMAAPYLSNLVVRLLTLNPQLTFRDIQHILIQSSVIDMTQSYETNGKNHKYTSRGGFGTIDFDLAQELCQNWILVSQEQTIQISQATNYSTTHTLMSEWVSLAISLTPTITQGEVTLSVTSPSNTTVTILHKRPLDYSTTTLSTFFHTNKFWNEPTQGAWLVTCQQCILHTWNITITGTHINNQQDK